jgi:hypothetical protein
MKERTATIGVSQALSSWILANRKLVVDKCPLIKKLINPLERLATLKTLISRPALLLETWQDIVKLIHQTNTLDVEYDAEILQLALAHGISIYGLSNSDRDCIVALIDRMPDFLNQYTTFQAIVEESVASNALSQDVANSILVYWNANTANADSKFSWSGCAFIGALAMAGGGPGAGAVGCLIGGILLM